MRKQARFLCLTILITLAVTTACRPKEIELPFETIELRQLSGTGVLWEPKEPGFLVMSSSGDLSLIEGLVTEDAQARLRSLDFNRYFAVAAFQGWQGYVAPGIEIQRIGAQGGIPF